MLSVLKTLEPNTRGRDFVIGDLHGAFSCLINLLDNLNFDAGVDRLISVGDLVDRGPDSLQCLELLREPWFHSVLSNHEQMMLDAFSDGPMGQYWFRNGGNWGLSTWLNVQNGHPLEEKDNTIIELLPLVEQLPLVITVNMPDGKKFHVLHAELPPDTPLTDEDLANEEKIVQLTSKQTSDGDFLLWGRHLFYQFYHLDVSNSAKAIRIGKNMLDGKTPFSDKLGHIISGHTVVQRPITLGGQTNIDTCAYGSYDPSAKSWRMLTCIELGTWKFYQASETNFRTVLPLTVNKKT